MRCGEEGVEDRKELDCDLAARAERKLCVLLQMAEELQIEDDCHPLGPLVAAAAAEGQGQRLQLLTLLEAVSAAQGPPVRRISLHRRAEVVR